VEVKTVLMLILLAAFWLAGAIYSAFCLWAPEMRPHHRLGFITSYDEVRFGSVTCIGLAMTFWLPALVYVVMGLGLLPGSSFMAMYLAACLGIFVGFIGSLLDIFG
jgi:hypothetical protein